MLHHAQMWMLQRSVVLLYSISPARGFAPASFCCVCVSLHSERDAGESVLWFR